MMITPEQERVLRQLVDVFLEENQKLNLSALRTPEACWVGNVLDSLAALDVLPSLLTLLPVGEGERVKKKIPPNLLHYAREMRKEQTAAEQLLWDELRDHHLGVHFRRQHPLDGIILDFYCHESSLGIEVDGSIHEEQKIKDQDQDRDAWLMKEHKVKILRFTNQDVLKDMSEVLQRIEAHLSSPPLLGEGVGVGKNNKQKQAGVGVGAKILDIGTGGGFPLLPLALCRPETKFTGLDATKKKIDAVGRIVTALDLKNVTLVSGRAEAFGHDPAHRQHYDIVMTRAVGALNELLELMAPFTGVNGYCIAWKSLHIDEELKQSLPAQKELNCELVTKHEYDLPGDFGRRQLVVFQKKKVTPKAYPRAVGVPKKTPIS